jgi:hypothetical protein
VFWHCVCFSTLSPDAKRSREGPGKPIQDTISRHE